MIADRDGRVQQLIQRCREDVKRFAVRVAHRQIEHLVEIAVVDGTFPADTYKIAAHDLLEGGGIEASFQQFHIAIIFAAQFEMGGIAGDRHVGQTKKAIEDDAELFAENPLIILFQLCLRRRQVRPYGIVDQIKNQVGVRLTITDFVEPL